MGDIGTYRNSVINGGICIIVGGFSSSIVNRYFLTELESYLYIQLDETDGEKLSNFHTILIGR